MSMQLCPECRDVLMEHCPTCAGSGMYDDCAGDDMDEWEEMRCMHCHGDGKTIEGRICPVCEGTGRMQ